MACEGCPNQMSASGESGTIRPGEARVLLTDEGGLICAYWTSNGDRVGTAELSRTALADEYPGLVADVDNCQKPLTAKEAGVLGKPAMDGACRPLVNLVGDVTNGDAVAEVFSTSD